MHEKEKTVTPVLKPALTPIAISMMLLVSGGVSAQEPIQKMDMVEVTSEKTALGKGEKKRLVPISEEVARTEQIGQAEIQASGATNLLEATQHRVGIDIQNECSICNAQNISLNNLPGRFTTIMIDGIPIYSAASAVYGLEGIPVNVLDRIEVARGAAMSLIAPEAIAGSVNLVTKKITKDEGAVRAEVGEDGSKKLDYFQGWTGKQKGQYLSINGQLRTHDAVDSNGNGISEMAAYDRKLMGIGVGLGSIAGWESRVRLDHADEKRTGGVGTQSTNFDTIKSNTTGNPFNWANGGSSYAGGWINPTTGAQMNYNGGLAGMAELIDTKRTQGTLISERSIGKDSYRLAAALAEHKQDSFYEGSIYNAKQTQSYLEGRWKHLLQDSAITTGVAYKGEQHRSTGMDKAGNNNSGIDNYSYNIPGVFAQYDFFALDGDLEVNLSARHDDHSAFGGITSPRMLIAYTHNPDWTSRFALGKGYRAPTTFFEQDHGILDTDVIRRAANLTYETAYNAGYNLTLQNDRTTWSSGVSWTQIDNMAKLNVDTTNRVTTLGNVSKPVTFTTFDSQFHYMLTPNVNLSVGGEYTQYAFDQSEEPLAFARPELRGFLGSDITMGAWDWRTRATWTGEMDLARFGNYANNQRYNLDGTPKLNKSPSYWLVDTRLGYNVDKSWKVYAGINNVFDEVQTKKESPLWLDKNGAIDVTHLWGLTHGRHVFIGTEYLF
jgi:outer membrane receptor for ferrienterochelin and colicins